MADQLKLEAVGCWDMNPFKEVKKVAMTGQLLDTIAGLLKN